MTPEEKKIAYKRDMNTIHPMQTPAQQRITEFIGNLVEKSVNTEVAMNKALLKYKMEGAVGRPTQELNDLFLRHAKELHAQTTYIEDMRESIGMRCHDCKVPMYDWSWDLDSPTIPGQCTCGAKYMNLRNGEGIVKC